MGADASGTRGSRLGYSSMPRMGNTRDRDFTAGLLGNDPWFCHAIRGRPLVRPVVPGAPASVFLAETYYK